LRSCFFTNHYEQYEIKEDNALKTIKRLSFELAELKEQKKECVDELDREKLIVLDQSNFINQLKVDMHAASKHHQSRNVKDVSERVIQVITVYTIITCKPFAFIVKCGYRARVADFCIFKRSNIKLFKRKEKKKIHGNTRVVFSVVCVCITVYES